MNMKPASRKAAQAPSFYAYSVKEAAKEGEKAHWTKIGALFPHEDGEGGTLLLDALPTGDRIVLRTPKADA